MHQDFSDGHKWAIKPNVFFVIQPRPFHNRNPVLFISIQDMFLRQFPPFDACNFLSNMEQQSNVWSYLFVVAVVMFVEKGRILVDIAMFTPHE